MIHPRSLVEACTGHLRQTRQWQSVSKADKYDLERESATSALQDLSGSFESIDLDSPAHTFHRYCILAQRALRHCQRGRHIFWYPLHFRWLGGISSTAPTTSRMTLLQHRAPLTLSPDNLHPCNFSCLGCICQLLMFCIRRLACVSKRPDITRLQR